MASPDYQPNAQHMQHRDNLSLFIGQFPAFCHRRSRASPECNIFSPLMFMVLVSREPDTLPQFANPVICGAVRALVCLNTARRLCVRALTRVFPAQRQIAATNAHSSSLTSLGYPTYPVSTSHATLTLYHCCTEINHRYKVHNNL